MSIINKFMHKHKRWLKGGLVLFLAVPVIAYGFLLFLSYRAADIFNYVAEHRQLFPGTVTVERLSATPLGTVSFENLSWTSPEGVLLAEIPVGEFHIKPLDVLLRHVGTRSITYLRTEGAYLHLILDENMELKGFRPEGEPRAEEKKEKKKKEPGLSMVGLKSERPFKCQIEFKGGTIEAEAPGNKKTSPRRHFVIGHADLTGKINTRDKMHLNITGGQFSGTVEAGAFYLTGNVDFAQEVPTYDFFLKLADCNPESLDVGMKLKDFATVEGRLTGQLPQPVFDGKVSFKELNLPALKFTEVQGDCHYEAGRFTAHDVGANIFGGTVEAKGYFDLEEKAWGLDLHGEGLKGSAAVRSKSLQCRVALNLHMEENRLRKTKSTRGDFRSGAGSYRLIPFNSLSGRFEQEGWSKKITFRDAVISLATGDVMTDAFSIEKGQLTLDPVYLREGEESLRIW